MRQFGTSFNANAFAVSAHSSGVDLVSSTTSTIPGQKNEGCEDAFLTNFETDDEDKKKNDGDNKKGHHNHDAEMKH